MTYNKSRHLELLDYRCASEEHVFWKSRHQFALLMENFINGIIDGEEFSDSFSGLHRKTVDAHDTFETDFEKLEDFQPDSRSNGFVSLMTFVYRECEGTTPRNSLRISFEMFSGRSNNIYNLKLF